MASENTNVNLEQGGDVLNLGDVKLTWDGTNLVITGLPTSDPFSAGALYSNSGVVTVSAG